MLCNFQIFSGCVCHLAQLHAQFPFLFPIVFGINLIPFFDILAQYSLSFARVCSPLLGPLRGRTCRCLSLCHCRLSHQISPSSPMQTPSQTKVCSTMGESIRPSSFYKPTLSANKHTPVKICRFRFRLPPMALQTVQPAVSFEPSHSTAMHKAETALKDRSVVP